jgi:hypothetical protein
VQGNLTLKTANRWRSRNWSGIERQQSERTSGSILLRKPLPGFIVIRERPDVDGVFLGDERYQAIDVDATAGLQRQKHRPVFPTGCCRPRQPVLLRPGTVLRGQIRIAPVIGEPFRRLLLPHQAQPRHQHRLERLAGNGLQKPMMDDALIRVVPDRGIVVFQLSDSIVLYHANTSWARCKCRRIDTHTLAKFDVSLLADGV